MKAEWINPFIESVQRIFDTMLNSSTARGKISVSKDSTGPGELLAIIGVSGDSKGTVAVAFPNATAMKIVGKIASMEFDSVDETVIDGVAEIINMIAGGAKAKLASNSGKPMDLSMPSVVTGKDFRIEYPRKAFWIEVPFESDLGPFVLRVTFEENKSDG